jgi:hypothetical protein
MFLFLRTISILHTFPKLIFFIAAILLEGSYGLNLMLPLFKGPMGIAIMTLSPSKLVPLLHFTTLPLPLL